MLGFYLGLISIVCWLFCTVPQLIMNCKSGSVDAALSFYFLIFWLAGDTCNLVGAILAKQLPLQIFTGIYYVTIDLVMIIQFLILSEQSCISRSRVARGGQIFAFFLPMTMIRSFDGFRLAGKQDQLGYTLGLISCVFYAEFVKIF